MTTRCLWLTKGLGRGGVERLLVDMFPLMDHDEFSVDVGYVLPWKDNHHRSLEHLGAKVFCLGARGTSYARWSQSLRQRIGDGEYDLIHSHSPVPGSVARILTSVGSGTVLIHTEHNVWARYRLPTRLLNSATYHRNRTAIAVSETVANSIKPMWAARGPTVHTIHHGTVLGSVRQVTQAERLERRQLLGLPVDAFIVGTVANFTAKKDHKNLLSALDAQSEIRGAHSVLIGLGPLEEELRGIVADRGLTGRVTFLGSRDDVFDLLPLFDAFCLSSQFEGFPIALVEAMATGLPCATTSVGGIPEIIEDGVNGLLVPPRDPVRLRQALETLMTDTELACRLASRAKQDAQRLDLQHAVDQMQTLYRDAVHAAVR